MGFPLATPDVELAASTDVIAPVLSELRREARSLFGADRVELSVTARMSRPYSEIARVRVDGGRSPALFVKVARLGHGASGDFERMKGRVANDFAVTRGVYEAMPRGNGLSVVKPIACYPQHLAIVTEEAAGTTLLHLAEHGVSWRPLWASPEPALRVAAGAGRWIEAFQRTNPSRTPLSLPVIRDYIDLRLVRLVENGHARFSRADRAHVLRAIDYDLARVSGPGLESVPIHGDLALGNILVDGERIVVLDFAMTTRGCRYYDVAHLHMQLGLLRMKPHFRGARVAGLQRALLRGFSSIEIAHEPLFRVMQVQHVVCHYLGLVERPAGRMSRAYNAWLAYRHLAWLRGLAAGDR